MPMPVLVEEKKSGEKTCPLTMSGEGSFGCVGAQCMAWRFARTHIKGPDGEMEPSDDTHGYCGLAGVPGEMR